MNNESRRLLIGELAHLVGVSTKTIRHYHKLGLLPEPERGENNYRRYKVQDVFRLQLIRRLCGLGFALADVGAILGAGNGRRELRHRLRELDRHLAGEIEALQAKRHDLINLMDADLSLHEFEGHQASATYDALLSKLARSDIQLPADFFAMDREILARLEGLNWQAGEPQQIIALVGVIGQDPRLVEEMISIYQSFARVRDWIAEDKRLPGLAAALARSVRTIRESIDDTQAARKKLGLYGETILAASDEVLEPAQIKLRSLLQEALANPRA